jgi:transcriptional regulator with XRE-family HTH domain
MKSRKGERNGKIEVAQLRAARAMLGWSQHDLSSRSGISARTIAAVELVTVKPKAETLQRLVACLQDAGIRFSRTREFWPQIALRPSSDDGDNASSGPIAEEV